jgi:hypothetical protein
MVLMQEQQPTSGRIGKMILKVKLIEADVQEN